MSEELKTEAAPVVPHVAIEQPATPVNMEHLGTVALPPGWSMEDVRDSRPRPLRPRGMAKLLSVADLVEMTKRFGSFHDSLVMVDLQGSSLATASKAKIVVHYSAGRSDTVGWNDWGAVHELEPSVALRKLMLFVHQGGDHRALVRLLDALVDYLVEPEAAVIHDAVSRLSLTKQVRFNRAEDLASGDIALSFETVTGAAAEAGRVRLPEVVAFSFPVFVGLESEWDLRFKLRYQLKDDGVTFRLECEDLADSAARVAEEVCLELGNRFSGAAQVVAGSLESEG
jgi:uncharacterized protein YfdQ (DUF2303 family)